LDQERRHFAHSTSRPDRADWQLPREHLQNVAELARERAAKFGAGEWGGANETTANGTIT
jgi:hypothetical protein